LAFIAGDFVLIRGVTEQFRQTKLALPLDVLAYISPHMSVCSLKSVFTEGIVRQLRAMVHCLVTFSQVLLLSFVLLLVADLFHFHWDLF